MTLQIQGTWAPSLNEDGWDITGTVTAFEWNNASLKGYYAPSTGLQFDTGYIGNYYFGVEGATCSSSSVSGPCLKGTASGIGQKVGTFSVTKS